MKYKQKIKFIVYFEQILQFIVVFFVVDFEEVSAGWEAKEGIDYRKKVDSSASATWSLNKGRCDNPFHHHTH